MATNHRRTEFQIELLQEMRKIEAEIDDRVILPNHYSIPFGVTSLYTVSRAVQIIHGTSSEALITVIAN